MWSNSNMLRMPPRLCASACIVILLSLGVSSQSIPVFAIFKYLQQKRELLYGKNPIRLGKNDPRFKKGFGFCYCSPTNRKPTKWALETTKTALASANNPQNSPFVVGVNWFAQCTLQCAIEECINADALHRGKGGMTLCGYDTQSGKNLITYFDRNNREDGLATLNTCDMSSSFIYEILNQVLKNEGLNIDNFKANGSKQGLCNTNTASAKKGAAITPSAPNNTSNDGSGKESPGKESSSDHKNENRDSKENPDSEEQNKKTPKNEGCVAVEHLHGYVLQHRRHLLRPVLCAGGFCATPNHAIIVNGKFTSMARLCAQGGWSCLKTQRLVNNLKISSNTRAVVGDITITPYDMRFPAFATWIVQILEDTIVLLLASIGIALASLGTLLFLAKIRTTNQNFPKLAMN